VPHCQSEQIVKGVVSDTARGVFQGKVLVRHGAQKTDARQLTRALVLSDRAEINHKPELEIYADDVVCAHGATAGDLDEAALFYLESRGIPRADARLMLVRAFLADALDSIADATINAALTQALDHALLQLGGGRL
jgi:Fe-S cluster assembly protein SufD